MASVKPPREGPTRVVGVKRTFLSPRALVLHAALVAWISMCIAAAWWQIGRAASGNSLSFLYAVEWPCFCVLGALGWWALLHVEAVTSDQEAERREFEARRRAEAAAARAVDAVFEPEDPTLAAYNDHLARLAEIDVERRGGR